MTFQVYFSIYFFFRIVTIDINESVIYPMIINDVLDRKGCLASLENRDYFETWICFRDIFLPIIVNWK